MESKKDLLKKFLKGIETGSAMAAAVVDENKYIQHNPQTREGGEGIAALFARISKTNPKVKFVRVFEDGDFAFAHNEYNFADVKIAFEVFRFENGRAVEHWDNLQAIEGPNPAGRTMINGATEITDLELTEANRTFVHSFVESVLIGKAFERLSQYVSASLIQHDPEMADGLAQLRRVLKPVALSPVDDVVPVRQYDIVHRVFAEGNFVLCMCEGTKRGVHAGLYDLFRVEDGLIIEHWSTIEAIPPRSLWRNNNGKF